MNRRRSRVSTSHPPTILARSRARQLAERSINNPMQTNESAPAHAGAADLNSMKDPAHPTRLTESNREAPQ